jgi:hypothetical protein
MTRRLLRAVGGIVAAASLAGAAAAWLAPRDPQCTAATEAPRTLDLRRLDDRTHLQQDVAALRAEADRFASEIATRPMLSDSPDALEGARTAPLRARAWCENVLAARLALTHGLTAEEVRGRDVRAAVAQAAQADTERANEETSPVVSPPSR